MQVDAVLQSKGTQVFTLPVDAALAEAVSELNRHNIGALVVTDDKGGIVGILSERDIIRQLGRTGGDTLQSRAEDCMTRSVITCARDTALDTVLEQMTNSRVRHMPILENGTLVGLVSIGDVVKRKIELAEQETAALKDYIAS